MLLVTNAVGTQRMKTRVLSKRRATTTSLLVEPPPLTSRRNGCAGIVNLASNSVNLPEQEGIAMVEQSELAAYEALRAVVSRLRDPDGGCPWDLEQTHETLRPFA